MPKRVVVTGCFQLFHRGHLNLLQTAARYGEITVLLNSNTGVWNLKQYIAEPFEVRKAHLLETGLVNRIIEFDTDPTASLCILRPDIIVAGSDHTKEEILQKGGCFAKEIIILPYTEGICSTDLYKGLNK